MDLSVQIYLDENIEVLLERLTFNVRLFNPIEDDTQKVDQVDIAWQSRKNGIEVKKSSHSDSSVKAFRNLKEDLKQEGVTVDLMENSSFLLTLDMPNLGFADVNTPLAFKIYLQENFMLDENISISHNLVGCSDQEVIADWKNGLGIEYTYPNVIMLEM